MFWEKNTTGWPDGVASGAICWVVQGAHRLVHPPINITSHMLQTTQWTPTSDTSHFRFYIPIIETSHIVSSMTTKRETTNLVWLCGYCHIISGVSPTVKLLYIPMSDVLTPETKNMGLFWHVKPRQLVNWNRRFGGFCYTPHIKGPKQCRRKLHNEELNDLYASPNIVWVIKSTKMRWAGHVALMGGKEWRIQGFGGEAWRHETIWKTQV